MTLAFRSPAQTPRPPALRFGAREPRTRLLAGGLLTVLGVTMLLGLATGLPANQPGGFSDFFGSWSFARFVHAMPPEQVYDPSVLQAFQAELGGGPDIVPRCFYPPTFMLLLWPFGLLPLAAAYAAWVAATLALYLVAVGVWVRKPVLILAAAVAPATLVTVITGQSGFLSAALLLAGWRLAPARPLVAGVLLGLLTFKPQLGVLVPVALVAAGCWRAVASAVVTTVLLVAAGSLVFGPAMWPAWLASIQGNAQLLAEPVARLDLLMPTVTGNLLSLGVSPAAARPVQAAVAIIVSVIVWRCFRRGPSTLAVAALLAATFLATPYALAYDLPALTAAVLLLIASRLRADAAFGPGEIAILILALMCPLIMPTLGAHVPVSLIALVLLLGLIVRTLRRDEVAGGFRLRGAAGVRGSSYRAEATQLSG